MAVPPRCHVCGYDMREIPEGEEFSVHFTEVWFKTEPEEWERYQNFARDWSGPQRAPGHYWFCFRHAAVAVERQSLPTRDALTEIRRITWLDMPRSTRELYVETAEKRFEFAFAPAYRNFLLEAAGRTVGAPVPLTDGGHLQELYGLVDVVEQNTDLRQHGLVACVPASFLLIGGGSGGAPCLRTAADDPGSIWWANFELAGRMGEVGPRDDIMNRIAPDFPSLLEVLHS